MRRRGQRGILFENEGHGIPGIEKNHDLAHAFRDAGMNAVIFHYRGSCGWAALTVGADERVKAVVTISAVVNPVDRSPRRGRCPGAMHPMAPRDHPRGLRPSVGRGASGIEPASRLAKPLLAIHPEADHAFIVLGPWLRERVVSWVERLASSHPGVSGRVG